MSDPTQLAKSSRELLASALNALQSNAHVPDELMAVAEPIADAMGLLHKIERSNGKDLEGREQALVHVRGALDALQKVSEHHPALDTVMECVATSLSKVHALTRVPAAAPAPAPAPVAAPAPAPVAVAAVPVVPVDVPPPPAAVYAQAQASSVPSSKANHGGTEAFPAPQAGSAGPRGTMAMQQSPIQQQPNPSPPIKTPFTAVPAQAAPAPAPAPPPQPAPTPLMQPAPAAAPASKAAPSKAPKVAGAVDVELGTHSSSNFYKGLGGNDVIDHGGLFVATYKIPKLGATVVLRVLLPGDLEFSASAVVQWTREASGSSEPGYGARFTQITQEGRHLVYRYTRNREPMFYDDL